jgi:hypothetical protein
VRSFLAGASAQRVSPRSRLEGTAGDQAGDRSLGSTTTRSTSDLRVQDGRAEDGTCSGAWCDRTTPRVPVRLRFERRSLVRRPRPTDQRRPRSAPRLARDCGACRCWRDPALTWSGRAATSDASVSRQGDQRVWLPDRIGPLDDPVRTQVPANPIVGPTRSAFATQKMPRSVEVLSARRAPHEPATGWPSGNDRHSTRGAPPRCACAPATAARSSSSAERIHREIASTIDA